MIYYRRAQDRGRANFGWLDSQHSFSFGHYYERDHMGISALRVINDDRVMPAAGFDTHPHKDMEIISYVLEGAIEHKDSLGNHFIVPAGDVQRMSAGTGITHSEFNASDTEGLRFLQIWIIPNQKGIAPGYEQKTFVQEGRSTLLVSPDGRDGSLSIHQDMTLSRVQLSQGEEMVFQIKGRTGFLQVLSGEGRMAAQSVYQDDGLGLWGEDLVRLKAETEFEALWFDLPPMG